MLLNQALLFAEEKHRGQFRKDGTLYILHPCRVAAYANFFISHHDKNRVWEIALLHDTLEDTDATPEDLEAIFGEEVEEVVFELTNQFTKDAYPHLKRHERKLRECDRLAKSSTLAQQIKLCDRLDNIVDMYNSVFDRDWQKRYIKETDYLLSKIGQSLPEVTELIASRISNELDNNW